MNASLLERGSASRSSVGLSRSVANRNALVVTRLLRVEGPRSAKVPGNFQGP
jgi:hypothetical protein